MALLILFTTAAGTWVIPTYLSVHTALTENFPVSLSVLLIIVDSCRFLFRSEKPTVPGNRFRKFGHFHRLVQIDVATVSDAMYLVDTDL